MSRKIILYIAFVLIMLTYFERAHAEIWVTCHSVPGPKITVGEVVHQMPDVQECDFFDDGMGGEGIGGGDWYYGGGGSTSEPDMTDRDISPKLKCVLDNYLHKDIKLTGGRTMKRVNAWVFRSPDYPNVADKYLSSNTPPGPKWLPIPGLTNPGGYLYGKMYSEAFQHRSSYDKDGVRVGFPSNSISGPISGFERSIFVAAHEISHLLGNYSNEELANWYGIDALQKYREEGGKKCSGVSN